tara:strand:+ start:1390 stop:1779 length:390 start_codon:yes stop_codon:yes gene_type:complete
MTKNENTSFTDLDPITRLGGFDQLKIILDEFYTRLLSDIWIGYIFKPFDRQKLINDQAEFVNRSLGGPKRNYKPRNLKQIHKPLKITGGHFDRRHQILKEVLCEFNVDKEIRELWLDLDLKFKAAIISR